MTISTVFSLFVVPCIDTVIAADKRPAPFEEPEHAPGRPRPATAAAPTA